MKYEKDDLYFLGECMNDGEYFYNGLAVPSKQAQELLGNKKIIEINRRVTEMTDWKTIIYGHHCETKQAFPRLIQFADYPTRSIIWVGYTLDEHFDQKLKTQAEFVYNDKIINAANYNILEDVEHYLIRIGEVLDNREFFKYLETFDAR